MARPTLKLRRDKATGKLVAYFGSTPDGKLGKYYLFLFEEQGSGYDYDYAEPGPQVASYGMDDYDLVELYEHPAEPRQVVVEKIVEVTQPLTEADATALELGRALVLETRANEALAAAIDAKAVAETTLKLTRGRVEKLLDEAVAASKSTVNFDEEE